jgi:hypothetical protein
MHPKSRPLAALMSVLKGTDISGVYLAWRQLALARTSGIRGPVREFACGPRPIICPSPCSPTHLRTPPVGRMLHRTKGVRTGRPNVGATDWLHAGPSGSGERARLQEFSRLCLATELPLNVRASDSVAELSCPAAPPWW